MARWVLDQSGETLDYPTLGFTADPHDILDATAAPDGRWSLNGDQGAAETVTRYTIGGDPSYVEPGDGYVLTWSDADNAYVPTARPVFIEADADVPVAALINDPASATATALTATYGAFIRADAHGVVGDWTGGVTGSGTNDTAAIQALVDAAPEGATIQFTRGKTYRVDSVNITKSLTLDFDTADLVVRPWDGSSAAAAPALRFTGSASSYYPIASAFDTATVVTLLTPGDAANFAPGDWLIVSDSKVRTTWNGGTLTGQYQMSRVSAVNSGTGAITLETPLEWTFDTSPRIQKATLLDRPVIKNIGTVREIDPGAAWPSGQPADPNIFEFSRCYAPRIEGVRASGVNLVAYMFEFCVDATTERTTASRAFRPTLGGHGYHTRFSVCHNSVARKGYARGMRHSTDYVRSYDCGSTEFLTMDTVATAHLCHGYLSKRTFSDRDTVLQAANNGTSCGWGMGNESFDADFGFTITRPTFRGVGIAFNMCCRSTGMTVVDPDVTTFKRPFVMQTGASGLVVRGGRVKLTTTALASLDVTAGVLWSVRTSGSTSLNLGDVTFEGVTFEGPATMLHFQSSGVVRLIRNRHLAPSMNYSASACYLFDGINPAVIDADGNSVEGGLVRSMFSMTGGTAASRQQRFTHNVARSDMSFGIVGNVTGSTVITGNNFRGPAGENSVGMTIAGDVANAKVTGALITGNWPQTYDSLVEPALATEADFNSATSAVNTIGKVTGKPVFCVNHTGGARGHRASGTGATTAWKNEDGTNAHVPA